MHDPRNVELAKTIVNQSIKLKKGEKILIQGSGFCTEALISAVIREAKDVGALPLYKMDSQSMQRNWLTGISGDTLKFAADADMNLMKQMDAFVGISAPENAMELSDVPEKDIQLYDSLYAEPVHMRIRVPDTRWVILRYPTPAMAQAAKMSTAAFEDWYYKVCTVNYSRMSKAMMPLKALMERSDNIHIVGPGETDLRFSIKGIPVVPCAGDRNIPDGEIYTAPVRDSVNGVIAYNTSSVFKGCEFTAIRFRFQNGRIVEASGSDSKRINEILDVDEGGRYVGEFALGLNPFITHTIGNTLFDEKIRGSIHFTPGNSYKEADNGNKSALHWDIVLLQDETHGGGEIYFDDVLVRKDGRFILPELEGA